jgi:hypothetical protein
VSANPKFLDTLCDALLGCAPVGTCLDSLPTGFRHSQLFEHTGLFPNAQKGRCAGESRSLQSFVHDTLVAERESVSCRSVGTSGKTLIPITVEEWSMRIVRCDRLFVVILVLAAARIFVGCQSTTQAQTTASQVQVVNTAAQPVPVTGNVNATVSGTPTVNLGSTATVSVGNTPTVSVGNTPTVNVASMPTVTITPPAVTTVSNMDDPGRIAYQSTSTPQSCPAGGVGLCWPFPAVPAGHRLVIQHISGALQYSASPNPLVVFVLDSGYHAINAFTPSANTWSTTVQLINFDQRVQVYVDASQAYWVEVWANGAPTVGYVPVIVTGYLLDCTAAPCAAIAH